MNSAGLIGDGYLPSRAAGSAASAALMLGFVRFLRPRPRGAPSNWGISPVPTNHAPVPAWSAVSRTTGCAMQFAMVGFPRSALRT